MIELKIVEEKGTVKRITSGSSECSIERYAKKVLEGTHIGDSIAVNGVCLTVTAMGHDWFRADVMPETIRRSSLGDLKPGEWREITGEELEQLRRDSGMRNEK